MTAKHRLILIVTSLFSGNLAHADELHADLADDDEPYRLGVSADVETTASHHLTSRSTAAAAAEPDFNHDDRDDCHLPYLDGIADNVFDVETGREPFCHTFSHGRNEISRFLLGFRLFL